MMPRGLLLSHEPVKWGFEPDADTASREGAEGVRDAFKRPTIAGPFAKPHFEPFSRPHSQGGLHSGASRREVDQFGAGAIHDRRSTGNSH